MLAMQNAELLAGVVLAQLINPGTPVIYGSTSTNIDMKSGALCIGSPELSQMIVAHAQLARYLWPALPQRRRPDRRQLPRCPGRLRDR